MMPKAEIRVIEDKLDLEDVRKAHAELKKHGTIPWETVKAKLASKPSRKR